MRAGGLPVGVRFADPGQQQGGFGEVDLTVRQLADRIEGGVQAQSVSFALASAGT